jgi:hypothetical protein
MAYTLKIETYEPLSVFEDWLGANVHNVWNIEFSGMSDLDDGKAMNKAKKSLVFRFDAESDKDAFKRAYLSGKI